MVSEANGKRREDCLGSIENSTNGIDYSLHRKVNIWSEQFYSLREFVENSRHPETAARVTQEGEGAHWSIEYFSCPNLASAITISPPWPAPAFTVRVRGVRLRRRGPGPGYVHVSDHNSMKANNQHGFGSKRKTQRGLSWKY